MGPVNTLTELNAKVKEKFQYLRLRIQVRNIDDCASVSNRLDKCPKGHSIYCAWQLSFPLLHVQFIEAMDE